ncbi:hypothetical protein [Geomicrobium sp. JCM 19039]|uniref:hypothetical protein n=1 Tax=Geomicrobium sp. JCM 19039 TaxID=1460636 RepID=UPI00045F1AA4|nr:hypothetical protein [Geomicrobium sp. JCM 19039]GAK11189.1 hypothetical protein JCM19039_870 [Geomicrobium sp. JCM 19039]
MLKIGAISVGAVVLVLSGVLFGVHSSAFGDINDTKKEMETRIMHEDEVANVVYFDHHYGDERTANALVDLQDSQQEVWMFNEAYERFDRIAADQFITKEQAWSVVEEEASSIDEQRGVTLGLLDGSYVYEVIYIDEEDGHIYHYVDAESGSTNQVLRLP